MLQNIRDSARGWLAWVIVIVICIPFALWGLGEYMHPAPKRVIAEVNGVELSERDFQQEVSQQQNRLRAMFQNQGIDFSFSDEQMQQLRKNTLDYMIEEELLVQSVRDANMRISDALLASRIHSFQAFHENGQFSQTRYEQTLRYQGMTPTEFEWKIRRALLTDQIREGVLRSALVTDYEQEQRTRLEDQERLISYLIIPTSRFNDSVTITEADIEKDYKEHAKEYMTPEKVSIEYVELSEKNLKFTEQEVDESTLEKRYQERKASFTTPGQWKARHILIKVDKQASEADIEAVKQKAQDVLAKIRAGESFEDLAKTVSDDPGSKRNGGDLGWFGSGTMVKPFEEAVKALKIGQVSELVKTQYGFHIIQLDDATPEVTKTYAQMRDKLKEEYQKERAESEFYGQVDQFANLAFEHPDSLELLTQTLKLESKTTELFARQGNTQKEDILSHSKVIEAAFSDEVLKEGLNSEVITLGDQHVVVLRVKEHQPAQAKPIAEVRDEIMTALKKERTQAQTKALGENLLDQIKQNNDPEIVKEHDFSWSSAQWAKRNDPRPEREIVGEAFKMGHPAEKTALYQGLQLAQGNYALIALLEVKDGVVTPPSSSSDSKENNTPDLRDQAKKWQERAVGESEFNYLISGLKTTAEIKNYQDKLSDEESL
jgi:peptidyl-prolyl cis-trans isomerase D